MKIYRADKQIYRGIWEKSPVKHLLSEEEFLKTGFLEIDGMKVYRWMKSDIPMLQLWPSDLKVITGYKEKKYLAELIQKRVIDRIGPSLSGEAETHTREIFDGKIVLNVQYKDPGTINVKDTKPSLLVEAHMIMFMASTKKIRIILEDEYQELLFEEEWWKFFLERIKIFYDLVFVPFILDSEYRPSLFEIGSKLFRTKSYEPKRMKKKDGIAFIFDTETFGLMQNIYAEIGWPQMWEISWVMYDTMKKKIISSYSGETFTLEALITTLNHMMKHLASANFIMGYNTHYDVSVVSSMARKIGHPIERFLWGYPQLDICEKVSQLLKVPQLVAYCGKITDPTTLYTRIPLGKAYAFFADDFKEYTAHQSLDDVMMTLEIFQSDIYQKADTYLFALRSARYTLLEGERGVKTGCKYLVVKKVF